MVTIYHNPACGTSRNALAMTQQSGGEPEVFLHLETPPTRERLHALIAAMGIAPYEDLGLDDAAMTDAALIDAIMAHPILIERPMVGTPRGTRFCHPS